MTFDLSLTSQLEVTLSPSSEYEEIVQNVRTILNTVVGSVPLDRGFGLAAGMLDEPAGAAQARLTAQVATALSRFEPRARLLSLEFTGDAIDGRIEATAHLELVERRLRGGLR